MAVSQELLTILVCPETKQPVALAPTELVDTLNAHIQNGSLKNRMGEVVSAAMDAALVAKTSAIATPFETISRSC